MVCSGLNVSEIAQSAMQRSSEVAACLLNGLVHNVDHDRGCLGKKVCATLQILAYIYNSSCKLCKFTTFYIPQVPKRTIFKSFISSLHARTSVLTGVYFSCIPHCIAVPKPLAPSLYSPYSSTLS